MFIIGNITRDPESRTTQSGKQVCSFTVAVNRPRTSEGQPDVYFFRVTAWNALADNCARYLFKGKKVAVTGPVSVSTYKAQNGEMKAQMEVYAQEVEFLTPASETPAKAAETPTKAPETQKAPSGFVDVTGEQLPF